MTGFTGHINCDGIITLAHKLGLKVVAEGVETPAHEQALRERGCDTVQGFLHSPPLPFADVTRFLQANRH